MNKKGFTLLELLGVIIIVSLLVTIVLPKITNSVKNFSNKTDALTLSMVKEAAKLYVEDNQNDFEKINGNSYCIQISDLVDNDYLKGPIEYNGENIVNTKGIRVKYNDGYEYKIANLYKGNCTLVDYIKNLYNETTTTTVNNIEYSLDETHLLMNDRLGSNDVAKTDGNIRYYGASPNNYIDIGDRDSDGNIILWRIIGVFKDIEVTDENDNVIKKEDLVKIIRADDLTSGEVNGFSWDYTSTGESDNNWIDSTLQVMLNDSYYNSGTTNYYNNSTSPITLDFASTGLSGEAHKKVERVNWSLSGHNSAGVYADVMYKYERKKSNFWSGKVALMNPSDHGYSVDLSSCKITLYNYAQSNCKSTTWMNNLTNHQWTLMYGTSKTYDVYALSSLGYIYGAADTHLDFGVRPVLYLNSDVGIASEKTTSNGLKYFVVE